MTARFEQAASITLGAEVEGGYANVPADRGGETYRGIARVMHPDWIGWPRLDAWKAKVGVRGLDGNAVHGDLDASVQEFYRTEFWDRVRGDEITSQSVANCLFDVAVNNGVGTAIQILQRALNILNRCDSDVGRWPDVSIDGDFGKRTMDVLNVALQHDAEVLVLWMVFVRGSILVGIMERRESQEAFARGWGKRLAGFIRRFYG